ncbi:MAG TPA: hypothetical protein VGH06_05605 [Candidatus Udaeobacter sp.]
MARRGLFVLLIAFAAPIAKSTSESPVKVSVTGLFKYPEKYHGKASRYLGIG